MGCHQRHWGAGLEGGKQATSTRGQITELRLPELRAAVAPLQDSPVPFKLLRTMMCLPTCIPAPAPCCRCAGALHICSAHSPSQLILAGAQAVILAGTQAAKRLACACLFAQAICTLLDCLRKRAAPPAACQPAVVLLVAMGADWPPVASDR